MKAYVYTHTRLDNNEVFYVGIGTQDNYRRASRSHYRTNYWNNIVKKCGWKVDIVYDKISWEDACKKEKELILKYGRVDLGTGTLVNLTDGGEGNFGRKASEKTRLKMSNKKRGIPHSKKHKNNISKAMKGKNSKKVIDTNTGVIYNSMTEAAEKNGLKKYNLSRYLTGEIKNTTTLKYYTGE